MEIDIREHDVSRTGRRKLGLDVMTVFIAPQMFEKLQQRLIGRGTETAEQPRPRRLAKVELAAESNSMW